MKNVKQKCGRQLGSDPSPQGLCWTTFLVTLPFKGLKCYEIRSHISLIFHSDLFQYVWNRIHNRKNGIFGGGWRREHPILRCFLLADTQQLMCSKVVFFLWPLPLSQLKIIRVSKTVGADATVQKLYVCKKKNRTYVNASAQAVTGLVFIQSFTSVLALYA